MNADACLTSKELDAAVAVAIADALDANPEIRGLKEAQPLMFRLACVRVRRWFLREYRKAPLKRTGRDWLWMIATNLAPQLDRAVKYVWTTVVRRVRRRHRCEARRRRAAPPARFLVARCVTRGRGESRPAGRSCARVGASDDPDGEAGSSAATVRRIVHGLFSSPVYSVAVAS